MITLTRLDHHQMVLNAELIATAESTPDTLLTLSNGLQYFVRETVEEVVARVVEYRRLINGVLRVVATVSDASAQGKA
jgi:flagellar protein FlbD